MFHLDRLSSKPTEFYLNQYSSGSSLYVTTEFHLGQVLSGTTKFDLNQYLFILSLSEPDEFYLDRSLSGTIEFYLDQYESGRRLSGTTELFRQSFIRSDQVLSAPIFIWNEIYLGRRRLYQVRIASCSTNSYLDRVYILN